MLFTNWILPILIGIVASYLLLTILYNNSLYVNEKFNNLFILMLLKKNNSSNSSNNSHKCNCKSTSNCNCKSTSNCKSTCNCNCNRNSNCNCNTINSNTSYLPINKNVNVKNIIYS